MAKIKYEIPYEIKERLYALKHRLRKGEREDGANRKGKEA